MFFQILFCTEIGRDEGKRQVFFGMTSQIWYLTLGLWCLLTDSLVWVYLQHDSFLSLELRFLSQHLERMCIHSALPPRSLQAQLFLMGQKLSLSCYTLVKEKMSGHTILRISCEPHKECMFSLLEKMLLLGANFFTFSLVHWTNALTMAIHVR